MTKTAYLTQETTFRKIKTLDLAHTKENLFKIKKFEQVKPRTDTINRGYLTLSRNIKEMGILTLNVGSEREAERTARSISLDVPRPRKIQVAQSQNV